VLDGARDGAAGGGHSERSGHIGPHRATPGPARAVPAAGIW